MEELEQEQIPQETKEGYVPRPRWQVWGARIGLVLFILTIIGYYMFIFKGGL